MTTPQSKELAPLEKRATVRQTPAEAFRLFTAEITSWWPLATHSVGGENANSVTLEERQGGQIVETMTDGSTAVWGTITAWDPPRRVRFTWHPGSPESEATEVEVKFTPAGEGTSVELVHTGWERRPNGEAHRATYDTGWDYVFGLYASAGDGALG